jgi:hypothetical protein
MGKFGKRRIPKFMDSQKDIQEMQVPNGLEQNHPVQIVSLGDHGDDHVMITIKAENGEELELKFDYNGDGMLTAQNGDHEYTIPVEVEIAEDAETEDDVYESHKAINSFDSFVNECWSPMLEGYNPAMSEEAKRAVKALTEEILIKEAQACSEDADPNHTYESYLNEVGQYMTDCMMESAAGIDVAETE